MAVQAWVKTGFFFDLMKMLKEEDGLDKVYKTLMIAKLMKELYRDIYPTEEERQPRASSWCKWITLAPTAKVHLGTSKHVKTCSTRSLGPSNPRLPPGTNAPVMVEEVAKAVWLAMQIGQVEELAPDDIAQLHDRYTHVCGQQGHRAPACCRHFSDVLAAGRSRLVPCWIV